MILTQLKLSLKKSFPNAIKSATYSVTSNSSQYIYNKICTCVPCVSLQLLHTWFQGCYSIWHIERLYLSGGCSDWCLVFIVGIILLSGIHIQKFKETFFSCTVDFKLLNFESKLNYDNTYIIYCKGMLMLNRKWLNYSWIWLHISISLCSNSVFCGLALITLWCGQLYSSWM